MPSPFHANAVFRATPQTPMCIIVNSRLRSDSKPQGIAPNFQITQSPLRSLRHRASGRVEPGSYPPGAPTDPDVPN